MNPINIPGYRIERELGQGGMSTVYLAIQESLDRPVALKVMAPALSADPNFGERFLKEARTVARLTHPNIVAIHDIGSANYHHYMAVEYVSGGDIGKRISQGMTLSDALDVLYQVATVLVYAHSEGFVHRDIKPENILFREDGTVVLTDFGIAKVLGASGRMSKTGMGIGTPHYMSPEQARGRTVDGRSDLYSLGVVFFQMLTGKLPYDGEDGFAIAYAHVNDPVPELPPGLAEYQPLIDRLMAKDPSHRFSDATAFIKAIDQIRAGETLERPTWAVKAEPPEAAPVEPAGEEQPGNPQSFNIKWAIAGVTMAVFLAAGFYWYRGSESPIHPESVPVAERTLKASGDVEPAPAPRVTTPTEEERQAREEAEKKSKINELLAAAEQDLAASRLTAPREGNALEKYRSILSLDSRNSEARQGLVRIVARYIESIDAAIDKGDFDRAEAELDVARSILPDDPSVAAGTERLVAAREHADLEKERRAQAEAARLAREAEERAEAERKKAREAAERAEAERRARADAEAEKRRSYEQYISAGHRALAANDPSGAEAAFREALSLYPDDRSALQALDKALILQQRPDPGDVFTNDLGMAFVCIGPGTFNMGSPDSETGRLDDEVLHSVTISRGFWMQATPVTQSQWYSIMGSNPAYFSDCQDCPVENVAWNEVQSFIEKLNAKTNESYRLPTEAEWEYAARGGSQDTFFFGNSSREMEKFAWYSANSGDRTRPVAQKEPNPWGLYDIYGNVWEWSQDWRGPYPSGEATDPDGPETGTTRILRGCSWFDDPRYCRSAFRNCGVPDRRYDRVGFRLVLPIDW